MPTKKKKNKPVRKYDQSGTVTSKNYRKVSASRGGKKQNYVVKRGSTSATAQTPTNLTGKKKVKSKSSVQTKAKVGGKTATDNRGTRKTTTKYGKDGSIKKQKLVTKGKAGGRKLKQTTKINTKKGTASVTSRSKSVKVAAKRKKRK